MNFKLGEAYVELRVDDARYIAELARARRSLDGLAAGMKNLGSTVASGVSSGIMRAVVGLLAIRKAGEGLEYVRDQAIDMETRMYRLGRASNLAGGELTKVGAEFTRFATTRAGVSMEDVFKLGTFGAKMGVQGSQLSLFTRDLAKMGAVMDDIPAEELATRVSRLITVFGTGYSTAINFGSALNKLDLMSNASARDILDITTRFSATAATLGMKPTHAMALATATRQAGIPVETAGTSMSQILGRMASKRDMGHFAKIAEQPMARFKRTLETMPLRALEQVAIGIKKISETKGPVAAEQTLDKLHLDGQRVRNTLIALTRVLPEMNSYIKAADQEWGSLSSIMKSFSEQAILAQSQLRLMWNNLELTAVAIGKHLLPVVKGFAEGVVTLTRDIRAWADSNSALFESWGTNIGEFFKSLGVLTRTFPDHMKLFVLTAQEKMEQLIEIFKRSREPLVQVFGWLADSATAAMSSSFGKSMRKMGSAFVTGFATAMIETAESLPFGDQLIKAMFGTTGAKMRQALMEDAIREQKRIQAEPLQDMPAFPDLRMGDVFKDLPGHARAKAKIQKRIDTERAKAEGEQRREKQEDEARDAQTRSRFAHQRVMGEFLKERFGIRGAEARQTPHQRALAERDRIQKQFRDERDAFNRQFRLPGGAGADVKPRGPRRIPTAEERAAAMQGPWRPLEPADLRRQAFEQKAVERGREFARAAEERMRARRALVGPAGGLDKAFDAGRKDAAVEQGRKFDEMIQERNRQRLEQRGLRPGGGKLGGDQVDKGVAETAANTKESNTLLAQIKSAIEDLNLGFA